MSLISPRAVLARVALQVPADCRPNLIVVGSLAAAYHLLAESEGGLVRTKDIDCVLVPRVEAVRAGKKVAEAFLAAGWRWRTEGPHALLASEADLREALHITRIGLLAHVPMTLLRSGSWPSGSSWTPSSRSRILPGVVECRAALLGSLSTSRLAVGARRVRRQGQGGGSLRAPRR